MDAEQKRKQSFLLRLPTSIREQAIHMAHQEDTSLNHFISLAVAEKITRLTQKPVILQEAMLKNGTFSPNQIAAQTKKH